MNISHDRKVFCLGLSRTGTTAIAEKFSELGLRTIHYSLNAYLRINELAKTQYTISSPRSGKYWEWAFRRECRAQDKSSLLETLSEYDAFADLPFPLLYRELSELFPNAYFILTSRDNESWLKSMEWLLKDGHVLWQHGLLDDSLLKVVYGQHWYEPRELLQTYRSHNDSVRSFFKGSDRFLELRLDAGDFAGTKLIQFLGLDKMTDPGIEKRNPQRSVSNWQRISHDASRSNAAMHFASIVSAKFLRF